MLDEPEYSRWMIMAKRTLESAKGDLQRGDHNWACFKAQQSAEFAVKALLHGLGLEAYGHSVSSLLSRLPKELNPSDIMQEAKTLDKYYVPTRYPNAWMEGLPTDYYTHQDAMQAIDYSGKIINWVEGSWRLLSRGKERE
ncbi:MAG: HEPN domain-containing protein [Nitrososphaerota archaeon]|nr:HEPN domain-containing protein [Nitrososphaerota archaeon]